MSRVPAIVFAFTLLALAPAAQAQTSAYDAMISRHAAANGVPEALVRRVIVRESRYNPRAIGKDGAMGMMQIKTATARVMGYNPASVVIPVTRREGVTSVGVVEGFRAALLGSPMPWEYILPGVVTGVLLVVVGAIYFRRMERVFVDVI